MSINANDPEYKVYEPSFPPGRDPKFIEWQSQLETLSSSEVSIRQATAVGPDGRRVQDLQALCAPIFVQTVGANVTTIAERVVLLAEIGGVHVGYCVTFAGRLETDPLFIQVVAVAPKAQRRGVGLALLTAAAKQHPRRNMALATRGDNAAALSLNDKFASWIGASIRRVNLGTYSDSDLGISRGMGYRSWEIHRP
ncbi:hypothetical protein GCM10009596_09070 [Arthrobacter rhombi]